VLSNDDDALSLEPNASYWGSQDPRLERIELTTLSPSLAIAEFRQGEIDLMRLSGTDVTRARDDITVSSLIMTAMPDRIIFLVPDVDVPPFDSVEVRRALSWMIDRRRLELIVEGRVIPAQRMFPPGMFPELDDAAAGLTAEFDVDAALEVLADTPLGDPEAWPSFGLDVPSGDSYLDRVARDVTLQLRENLGVQVPIRVHDPEEYAQGLRERRYPLAWMDWSYPYADPASVYGELFASWRDPDSPISWSDEEYDELIRVADTLTSAEERASAYAGCEGLLQEHGACIPLVHPVDFYLVQPWIEGLPRDGRGRLITGDRLGVRIASELTVNDRRE
jgi:ABC-type transport system substrate-binding protein